MKYAREKWVLATTMAAAVNACNAPFCSDDGEKEAAVNDDKDYVKDLAAGIAEKTSIMAIEDAITVLQAALPLCFEHRVEGTGVYKPRL